MFDKHALLLNKGPAYFPTFHPAHTHIHAHTRTSSVNYCNDNESLYPSMAIQIMATSNTLSTKMVIVVPSYDWFWRGGLSSNSQQSV